jgi:hypothetical protein
VDCPLEGAAAFRTSRNEGDVWRESNMFPSMEMPPHSVRFLA